jgi:hypothetical protein
MVALLIKVGELFNGGAILGGCAGRIYKEVEELFDKEAGRRAARGKDCYNVLAAEVPLLAVYALCGVVVLVGD